MPSTGFITGSSVSAFSTYTQWNLPKNLRACDTAYAEGTFFEFNRILFDIQADGNIPVGSTVDGFEMAVTGKRNSGSPQIYHWLSKDGVNLSTTTFSYTWGVTTPTTQTFGSPTNDWGVGLTAIGLNNSVYGIIGNFATSTQADYDCVLLNTYYTLPPVSPTQYTFKSGNYVFKSGATIYK